MNRIWPWALCLMMSGAAWGAEPPAPKPLLDGLFLQDVNGRLAHDDVNDVWLFDLTADVNAAGVNVPAGTDFILLPSGVLADIIADSRDRLQPLYRLSVQVTQYQGRNYLLPIHYLSWSRLKEPNEPAPGAGRQIPGAAEPNKAFPVPPEIAKALQGRPPLRAQPRVTASPSAETSARVLVDVVGFLEQGKGQTVFVPDAWGLNVSAQAYVVLPNAILEQAERTQTAARDRIRFSIAGQVSAFKGRSYLLLLRAARAYSYGDFGG